MARSLVPLLLLLTAGCGEDADDRLRTRGRDLLAGIIRGEGPMDERLARFEFTGEVPAPIEAGDPQFLEGTVGTVRAADGQGEVDLHILLERRSDEEVLSLDLRTMWTERESRWILTGIKTTSAE